MDTALAPRPPIVTPAPELGRRARADAAVRSGATAALWLTVGLVSYWWLAGGGIGDLAARESGLTSLGRLAGLLASDLLLVQVLLMARLPVLEGAFGRDRLVRLHRVVGFTSFNLMVAHLVLITWGYAAGEPGRIPATLWELARDYPGMLLALAGGACLVMVAVTSVRSARTRLRYESWHLLHLYAYLGVGLALPHQLWTGQEFLASPAATVFWWGLWGLAAGAIVVWRVAVPLWRSLRHRLRVASVVAEGDGVFSVHLTGRHLRDLGAEAGQFFVWRFLGRRGWTRANPYSLSAAPDGRSLRITVKELGDGSAALRALRPGTPVLLEGPYGRLSARSRTRRRLAFIGAGVGITPLRALAEGMDYAPGDAVLLHRFTGRPLFERELPVLAARRGLRLVALPGPRRPGSWLGRDTGPANGLFRLPGDDVAALRALVPDIAERDVYVCGPPRWTESVRRTAAAAGLPPDHLHVEAFGW